MHRPAARLAQVDAAEVGPLAGQQAAREFAQTEGARALERGHAQQVGGDEFTGRGADAGGDETRDPGLGEQIEVVIRGRAVRPQGHADPAREHPGDRADAGPELEVRLGAVDHAGAGRGEGVEVLGRDLGHVDRHELRAREPECREPGERPLAVGLEAEFDLARRLVQVHRHRQVEFVGQPAHARDRGVAHRVGRVRREVHAHQRIAPVLVAQPHAAVDVLVGGRGPARRGLGDDQADAGAHVGRGGGLRNHLGPQVHVGEAGDAAADHLGDGELGAVTHVFRVDPAPLERPDRLAQPGIERQVLRAAAQQDHRGVRVRVHESRQQHVVPAVDRLPGLVAQARLDRGQHLDDAAVADGDGVVLQHPAVGLDGDHPACGDECVDGLHAGRALGRVAMVSFHVF